MPQPRKKDTIDINDERKVRMARLERIVNAGMDAFPAVTQRTHTASEALEAAQNETVCVAGRIMGKRSIGKIAFCRIKDASGEIQAVFRSEDTPAALMTMFSEDLDVGDIIEVGGVRFVTQKGQESILVQSMTLLTKALRPLPDKHKGLQDEELKFRKRYLDLLINDDLRELFVRKSRFWNAMRAFLVDEGFLEVETPVLETTAGGAEATPFVTHHNALDIDVYLRISMGELWQKRLMVGGFEKTFEIGRQFRNEGMSREHLQDYTQMECYWAYADYRQSMHLMRRMYQHVIQETFGTLSFEKIGEFHHVDFSGEWEELDYATAVLDATGIDVRTATDADLRSALKARNVELEEFAGRGRMIDALWKQVRKGIQGPVFLVNHPVDVSPLAKRQVGNSSLTQRYQIVVAGSEMGNGYSELNDPIDQAQRFEAQAALREAGDTEAQMHDADFVEALEHGMPPTAGFGVSERLFSFLENRPIRECVLFPLMRPKEDV